MQYVERMLRTFSMGLFGSPAWYDSELSNDIVQTGLKTPVVGGNLPTIWSATKVNLLLKITPLYVAIRRVVLPGFGVAGGRRCSARSSGEIRNSSY